MKELISVIVPVYNTEKYIDRCIDSIISQTYQNIEVILIDDGSIDNSLEICEKYMTKNPKIKVVHQENKGVSNARNKGLSIAKGNYFICIDSDDWLEPNMLEILYNNIQNYDADIATCNFYNDYESGEKTVKNDIDNDVLILTETKEMYESLFASNKFGGYLWNKLIRTSKIKNTKENIYFNEKIAIEEDVMFLINVFKRCRKICYDSSSILYHYFQRATSSVRFNYTLKDITKLYTLEEKLKLKESYKLKSLDKLEYEYVFLLMQSLYIVRKDKVKKNKIKQKIKSALKKYYKTAIKEANLKQKIKLIVITICPITYGRLARKGKK